MEVIIGTTVLVIQKVTWNGKTDFQKGPSTPIINALPNLQYQELLEVNDFGGLDAHQSVMGVKRYGSTAL